MNNNYIILRLFPLPEDFLDIGLLGNNILSYKNSQWRDRDDMWMSKEMNNLKKIIIFNIILFILLIGL